MGLGWAVSVGTGGLCLACAVSVGFWGTGSRGLGVVVEPGGAMGVGRGEPCPWVPGVPCPWGRGALYPGLRGCRVRGAGGGRVRGAEARGRGDGSPRPGPVPIQAPPLPLHRPMRSRFSWDRPLPAVITHPHVEGAGRGRDLGAVRHRLAARLLVAAPHRWPSPAPCPAQPTNQRGGGGPRGAWPRRHPEGAAQHSGPRRSWWRRGRWWVRPGRGGQGRAPGGSGVERAASPARERLVRTRFQKVRGEGGGGVRASRGWGGPRPGGTGEAVAGMGVVSRGGTMSRGGCGWDLRGVLGPGEAVGGVAPGGAVLPPHPIPSQTPVPGEAGRWWRPGDVVSCPGHSRRTRQGDIFPGQISSWRPGGGFKRFAIAEAPDLYRNLMGGAPRPLGRPRCHG